MVVASETDFSNFLAESRSAPSKDFGAWIGAGKRERITSGATPSTDQIIAPPHQMSEVWVPAVPIPAKVGATGSRESTTSASPTSKIQPGSIAETLMYPKTKRALLNSQGNVILLLNILKNLFIVTFQTKRRFFIYANKALSC